jgi:transposase
MFVRTKSSPRSENISVQIVESQRINGKIKQHVVRHLGTTKPGEELEKLKQLARSIMRDIEHNDLMFKTKEKNTTISSRFGMLSSITDDLYLQGVSLEESKRVIIGIHDIYGYIYDHIGFKNPFTKASKRKVSANILREIVMARIANPDSKRASVNILSEQFGVDLNLDHVYQMMDKIDDIFCERIQKYALAATLQLTGDKLRVMFYDATTLYFESFTEDDLKQNGYSKDLKFNQPQILLALFVTEGGLPVGYELFPGSSFEGHTLTTSLNKLKERYGIQQVVFVADRGMLSDVNLRFLEENNYRYIVGARLKSLDEVGTKNVLEWVDSIPKDKLQNEVTHRITVTPDTTYPIKIFLTKPTEYDISKIIKQTYVLWHNNSQWTLAIYENSRLSKSFPISIVPGLSLKLSQIHVHEKKISRQNRAIVKDLISKYHNKPRLLVLSYKPNRAFKDRADREKSIQKLQVRLKRSKNPKQLVSKYGFQKFIKVEGDAELQIDPQKLQEESRWDGISGIYINDKTLTNDEVIGHYCGLWQVEESFRIQKHDLKLRPIYHWTPARVKAHIAISFMAFVCVRYLEYRVATQSQKLSPKSIRNILTNYQASIIKDTSTNKSYLMPSKLNSELNEIYRVIGQKPSQGLKEIQCSA